MPPRSTRPRSPRLGAAAALTALALLAAWGATLNRNAWAHGPPNYASIHRGNATILSTTWRAGENGVRAWSSTGWMYDVRVPPHTIRWRPSLVDIGTVYLGTPPYRAPLSAIFVPLWTLALVPAALAIFWLRPFQRRHAPGCCRACGYDLKGLHTPGDTPSARCPECGSHTAPTTPRQPTH